MKFKLTKKQVQDWRSLEGIVIADTPAKLEEVEKILDSASLYALDTEAAGYMKDGSKWDVTDHSPVGKARAVSAQFTTPEIPKIFVPNWGEYEGSIGKLRRVLEKNELKSLAHNCLEGSTRVFFADGRRIPIAKVVANKVRGSILCVDETSGQLTARPIVDWVKSPPRPWTDWLAVDVRGRGQLRLTHDHEVITTSGRRQAKDLKVGDKILSRLPEFSPQQRALMLGSLLGDGSLIQQRTAKARTPYFKVAHGEAQLDYVTFKKSVLGELVSNEATHPNGGKGFSKEVSYLHSLSTKSDHRFFWLSDRCLRAGKRAITKEWLEELTPAAIAIWFCDDGAYQACLTGAICVSGFGSEGAKLLEQNLRARGFQICLKTRRDGHLYLHIKGPEFWQAIAPFVPKCMARKLPTRYHDLRSDWWSQTTMPVASADTVTAVTPLAAKMAKTAKSRPSLTQYCLVIEGHRNFISEGLCVSNCKFDFHVLMNHGINASRGLLADTMVMDFHYNSSEYHGLKECINRYFGEDTEEFSDVFRQSKVKKSGGFAKSTFVPSLFDVIKTPAGILKLVDYSTKDTVYTLKLYQYLKEKLEETPWIGEHRMMDYYNIFERPYNEVLFEMERRGCRVDVERLKVIAKEIEKDETEAKRQFFKTCVAAGVEPAFLEKFNLSSGPQIAILFERKLGIQLPGKTKKGAPKTDVATLELLKGKGRTIVEPLLVYKRLEKLRGTYVEPLTNLHHEYNGKIHTNLKQLGTQTGRLSSATPNLQNVPTAHKDKYGLRGAFLPPEGHVLGDIDLSMIEMRIAAHFSEDPTMLSAIRQGWDLHSLTSAKTNPEVRAWVAGRAPSKELLDEIKIKFKTIRDREGKTLNFSTLYGAGPPKIAQISGMREPQAVAAIAAFFDYYKGLKRWMDATRNFCRAHGYITTYLKRRVYIPGIRADRMGIRMQAERQCVNYVIQGCQPGKNRVLTTEGYARLDELIPGSHTLVQATGTTADFVVHDTGIKECFTVATSGGRTETTADHRFLVSDGFNFSFKKLADLRVGDFVLELHAPVAGKTSDVPLRHAELLGVLLGDGCYSGRGVYVAVGKAEDQYASHVNSLLTEFFGRCYSRKLRKTLRNGEKSFVWSLGVHGKADNAHLQKTLGLLPAILENKRIPKWVFSASEAVRGAVLRGLFDTDGSVAVSGLTFTSCGVGLPSDVKDLLSSLGIWANIRKHGARAFRATVPRSQLKKFELLVGFSHARKAALLASQIQASSGVKRRERDTLPSDLVQEVGRCIQADPSWRHIRSRISSSEYVMRARMLSSGKGSLQSCIAALRHCENSAAKDLLYVLEKYRWVKIQEISSSGSQKTFDIETFSSDHSYIADGFMQHNSAADFLKMSMLAIHRNERLKELGVKMILQIHDELLFEVPTGVVDEAKGIIETLVSNPFQHPWVFGKKIKAPIVSTPAEFGVGENWQKAK